MTDDETPSWDQIPPEQFRREHKKPDPENENSEEDLASTMPFKGHPDGEIMDGPYSSEESSSSEEAPAWSDASTAAHPTEPDDFVFRREVIHRDSFAEERQLSPEPGSSRRLSEETHRQVNSTENRPNRISPSTNPERNQHLDKTAARNQGTTRQYGQGSNVSQNRNRPLAPPQGGSPAQQRAVRPPSSTRRIPISAKKKNQGSSSCVIRGLFFGVFGLALFFVLLIGAMFFQYYRIASTLPDIDDLRERASQFETTRIYDRDGNLLYEILDPSAGRRTYVPLSQISPNMVAATIATEDKGFYSHPGFDIAAIMRAFVQNYQGGEIVSGASTITQQLARNLLFSPEERNEQSYARKMREAILAAEITRRYSKDEILELYINEIYYGNLAYGVQAAAETYFGTQAQELDLSQASFLAGLPQSPAVYDVYTNPEATFARQKDVLLLMFQFSEEDGCIYVSNSPERVCVDAIAVTDAVQKMQNQQFKSPDVQIRYPHWVNYIRSQLESQFDSQTIYRAGFNVYTTLDPRLQKIAEDAVKQQIAGMKAQNAGSGALVAIQPTSGEILAMVGSADFYSEAISGQVNMAVSPRQPGSSIKPLTYLAAFEKGWTPSTLIWDVPSEFPPSGLESDPNPPYEPVNYDGAFHGPVKVRSALANSYNIPAVKTLQYVGIYDDPAQPGEQGFIAFARRMGIKTLDRADYGLSLTLGGGDVTLLDLTGAYAVIANRGVRIQPTAITKITDFQHNVVFEQQKQMGEQVIRAEHAYLITSILSDNKARTPAFGPNSLLKLSFPAAVKTGTTNDFRDNWTLGFSSNLVVGVWVGNPDYTPMKNTTGMSGAAPIWANVMETANQKLFGSTSTSFSPPPGVVEQVICSISGTSPSQWCPSQSSEIFAFDQPPRPSSDDLWQKAALDTWTGLRASPACSDFVDDRLVLNVQDQFGRRWIRRNSQGQAWAAQMGFEAPVLFTPTRECRADDPRPHLEFAYPREQEMVREGYLDIYAVINADNGFDQWQLSFGMGDNPVRWEILAQGKQAYNQPDVIHRWDLIGFPNQLVTLRLYLKGEGNAFAERKIHVTIEAPTATPEPTETPEPIPTEVPPTPQPTQIYPPPATEASPILPTDLPVSNPTIQPTKPSIFDWLFP